MSDVQQITQQHRIANKAGTAKFFDVTPKTIDAWIRDGMPVIQRGPRGKSWQIDLLEAARWRFATRLAPDGLDPETLPPGERKLWYDGETKRRDLQVRDRQLISADEVQETTATAYAGAAQSFLSLADNLERRGLPVEYVQLVDEETHRMLAALAEKLSNMADLSAQLEADADDG